jgi:SAM-dependent methyltransferase
VVIQSIKSAIRRSPLIYKTISKLNLLLFGSKFQGSEIFWIDRYSKGGNSGSGSYNQLAEFKAEILNDFVDRFKVNSVIEYGCGDGNQLGLANYPNYLGFDVSPDALALCKAKFSDDLTKKFKLVKDYIDERAELTLSLDVTYHLVEDSVFESYMERLFTSSDRWVIIYSSNFDEHSDLHVKHREFTKWVERSITDWKLLKHIPNRYPYQGDLQNSSSSDFYVYTKIQ